MSIVCDINKLLLAIGGGVIALIGIYYQFPSPWALMLLVIPGVLGIVFLILWALTTSTGMDDYSKLFLIAYIVSVGVIEVATLYTYHHTPNTTASITLQIHKGAVA